MAEQHGRELYPLGDMSDDEIRDLVVDHLTEERQIDPDLIDVRVSNGQVTVAGRVGTDAEVQIVESLLSDLIGVETFQNDLVVDELNRGEAPFAADDDIARDAETVDQLGEPNPQQSDTAEHLVENLDAETFGTYDMGEAIQDGTSYTPPDRPFPSGYRNRENH